VSIVIIIKNLIKNIFYGKRFRDGHSAGTCVDDICSAGLLHTVEENSVFQVPQEGNQTFDMIPWAGPPIWERVMRGGGCEESFSGKV
jgi:hypothetical protein